MSIDWSFMLDEDEDCVLYLEDGDEDDFGTSLISKQQQTNGVQLSQQPLVPQHRLLHPSFW